MTTKVTTQAKPDSIQLFLTLPLTIKAVDGGFEAKTPALNWAGMASTPRLAVIDLLRRNSYDAQNDSPGLYFPNRETLEGAVNDLLQTYARKTEWTIKGHIYPAPLAVESDDHWSERLVTLGDTRR